MVHKNHHPAHHHAHHRPHHKMPHHHPHIGRAINNNFIKPVDKYVVKPIYTGIIEPRINAGTEVIHAATHIVTRTADVGLGVVDNASHLLNPNFIIGGLALVAIIVLNK